MCGLVGFIDLQRNRAESELKSEIIRMADRIAHRGPDSSGYWIDAKCGVALGHRRLAIQDLSEHGHQPMRSACGRYITVYNGEIYNFNQLRQQLEPLGHRFNGHSDTEVMLAAIAEWGLQQAVTRFVGMFAIALWDIEHQRLSLVRDRFGIKPLYFGRQGDVVYFGSELHALAEHSQFDRTVDRDALALYLARGYVPAPTSIYQNIGKVHPGHILTLDLGGDYNPRTEAFWSLHEVAEGGKARPFSGDIDASAEALEQILGEAIEMRMIADVPLGTLLSGGIDSSLVTAMAQQRSTQPLQTFTIGFDEKGYDESAWAEEIATHLGTRHTRLMVSPEDAMQIIPLLGRMYDEPFADFSQIPTFIVSRLARSEVKVVLTGDGGDESFAGYDRHLWSQRISRSNAMLPGWSRNLLGGALTMLSAHQWDRLISVVPGSGKLTRPGQRIHRYAGLLEATDPGAIYTRLMTLWQNADQVAIGSSLPQTLLQQSEHWPKLDDPTSLFMYLDAMSYLPDQCLTKVDRASMAVALEARVPLLDHRVAEFAWSLPMDHKLRQGEGKQVLRRILQKHIPKRMIDRPKMGFGVPIRHWLRGPLRDWAEHLLDEQRLRSEGYLDPIAVRRVWNEHLDHRNNWQNQLWTVLMFQAWLDTRNSV